MKGISHQKMRFAAASLKKGQDPSVKQLISVLISHVDTHGDSCPGNDLLCVECDWCLRNLQMVIAEAKELGLIQVYDDKNDVRHFQFLNFEKHLREGEEICTLGRRKLRSKTNDSSFSLYIEGRDKEETGKEAASAPEEISSQTDPEETGLEDDSSVRPTTVARASSRAVEKCAPTKSRTGKSDTWPAVDDLGKTPEDWKQLFNWMMEVMKKPLAKWGGNLTNPLLEKEFVVLKTKMSAGSWWPTEQQLEAVSWRYSDDWIAPKIKMVGEHRVRTEAVYFIRDFYDVATECETECNRYRRLSGEPFHEVGDTVVKDEKAFLRGPMQDWTQDQLEKAIKFGWGPPKDELVAEQRRRADRRRMEAKVSCK